MYIAYVYIAYIYMYMYIAYTYIYIYIGKKSFVQITEEGIRPKYFKNVFSL